MALPVAIATANHSILAFMLELESEYSALVGIGMIIVGTRALPIIAAFLQL
jgi:hypothetical protein